MLLLRVRLVFIPLNSMFHSEDTFIYVYVAHIDGIMIISVVIDVWYDDMIIILCFFCQQIGIFFLLGNEYAYWEWN